MAVQGEQLAATGSRPYFRHAIFTSADNPESVRRKSHRVDPALMAIESEHLVPRFCIPNFGGPIVTPRNNPLAVLGKGNAVDLVRMASEGSEFEMNLSLPEGPFEATARIAF